MLLLSTQQQVCPEATSVEASFPYSALDVQDLAFTATGTSSAAGAVALRCTVDSEYMSGMLFGY